MGVQRGLVPVGTRPRPVALYRIPVTLMMLGLFMMALQAGHPLLGLAMLVSAISTTIGCAWRGSAQGSEAVTSLRGQADHKLVDGRYAEARALYERSLALAERELPPAAPELLAHYYSLAAVNSMLHDYGRAGRYLDELLCGLDGRVPAPWAGHVAWLMRRVAHHQSRQGQHAEAERLCRRALDLVGDAPGADDNSVRSLLDDLAWVSHHAGRYEQAEQRFREALALHEQFRDVVLELSQGPRRGPNSGRSPYRSPGPAAATTSGGLDRAVALSRLGLGWTLYERGRYEEAQRAFDRAAMIAKRQSSREGPAWGHDADDFGVASPHDRGLWVEVLRGQGAVAVTQGRYAEAREFYERAQRFADGSEQVARRAALLIDTSWLARCEGQLDEADEIARRALALIDDLPEGADTTMSALHEGLAELRRKQGRPRQGQRHIAVAQELAARCLGPEHPRMGGLLAVAARLHAAHCELVEAEREARRSLAIFTAHHGANHPRMADAYLALGSVQRAKGQLGAAELSLGRAYDLRAQSLGPRHPELREVVETVIDLLQTSGRHTELAVWSERAALLPAAVEPEASRDSAAAGC